MNSSSALGRITRRPLATRHELIPSTALALATIGQCGYRASEMLGLYAYLRPSPGTISEMRFELSGQQLHRCNQLESAKGGSHFRTPEPRKWITD